MSKSLKLKSAVAGLALALSAASLAPAAALDFSSYHEMGVHDYWYSFSVKMDGTPATGAATNVGRQASAAILLTPKHMVFFLDNQQWRLRPDSSMSVRMTLDGIAFNASAIIVSPKQLMIGADDREFIKHLVNASEAVVEVNGDRWALNLEGMREALSEAFSAIKNASD